VSRKKSRKGNEVVFTKTFNYRYSVGNLMDVEVTGHRSNKLKSELAVAAEYYASLLMPRRICKNTSLTIQLKNRLAHDATGYCEYSVKDGPYREFTIELNKKLEEEEIFKYLAHEMVHLKQFALGELNDGTIVGRNARWQSKHFDEKKIDYWDQPWEIEAYGREIGLYTRYLETFGGAE